MTTLPQNAINSVTQFIRVITKIFQDHLSRYLPFINNIGVKGPKTIYNNKEMTPNIRKYVLKHIQWLDRILADLERTNYTISDAKSQFYIADIRVIRYLYDIEDRHPDTSKIIKIFKYLHYDSVTETRVFLDIYIYFRI